MQATHDVLFHGTNIAAYDHLEFPGVVPRTFLGAVTLAVTSWPIVAALRAVGLPKVFTQLAVRGVLAAGVCLAYQRLVQSVDRRFGPVRAACHEHDSPAARFYFDSAQAVLCTPTLTIRPQLFEHATLMLHRTSVAMIAVVASTPHVLFYASRTLPNTFALLLMLFGCSEWLRMDVRRSDARDWSPKHLFRAMLAFVPAVLWFRCDMVVLLGPILLAMLASGAATLGQLLLNGGLIGVAALSLTVVVDSWFWRRWLWPEGEVLWFNTAQNRSHEYGVSPWHWYASSALPRAMLAMLLFVPVGCLRIAPLPPRPSFVGMSSTSGVTQHSLTQQLRAALQRVRPDWEVLQYVAPALAFIALYSILPHKELRFIMPGLPLLHLAAARGLTRTYHFALSLLSEHEARLWWPLAPTLRHTVITTNLDDRNGRAGTHGAVASTAPAFSSSGRAVDTPMAISRGSVDRISIAADGNKKGVDGNVPASSGARASSPVPPASSSRTAATAANPPSMQPTAAPAPLPALRQRTGRRGRSASPSPRAQNQYAAAGNAGQVAASLKPVEDSHKPVRRVTLASRLLGLAVLLVVAAAGLVSAVGTGLYVRVSMDNYPGGAALQRLYTLYAQELVDQADLATPAITAATAGTLSGVAPGAGGAGVQPKLPPCPEGDVTGSGMVEWWRQCMEKGCPSEPPWSPAFASSDARLRGAAVDSSSAPSAPVCAPALGAAGQVSASPNLRPLSVHIDVASAETGVSRFGESWSAGVAWVYSKAENLTRPSQFADFTFLLTENATRHADFFEVMEAIPAYSRIDWASLRVVRKPRLFIMRRRPGAPKAARVEGVLADMDSKLRSSARGKAKDATAPQPQPQTPGPAAGKQTSPADVPAAAAAEGAAAASGGSASPPRTSK